MKLNFCHMLLFSFALAGAFSCKDQSLSPVVESSASSHINQAIMKVNKYMARRNRDHIESFVRRTGWSMKQTGSGLWIEVLSEGKGNQAKSGQRIHLEYELKLLDGTIVESSSQTGPLDFRIGQGGVESGLEEGVLHLKEETSARLLIPPHLAYGNFGNQEKGIPPDAILLYEIKVISIL